MGLKPETPSLIPQVPRWYLVVFALVVKKAIIGYKHAALFSLIKLTGCSQASLIYWLSVLAVSEDVIIATAICPCMRPQATASRLASLAF